MRVTGKKTRSMTSKESSLIGTAKLSIPGGLMTRNQTRSMPSPKGSY